MTIDAGQLDRLVQVLKRVPGQENGWEQVFTYVPSCNLWAALKHDSEDEQHAAGQTYSVRVVTFTTRYSSRVTERDRLSCEGITYEVLGIRELGRREGLEIKAQTIDPEAV